MNCTAFVHVSQLLARHLNKLKLQQSLPTSVQWIYKIRLPAVAPLSATGAAHRNVTNDRRDNGGKGNGHGRGENRWRGRHSLSNTGTAIVSAAFSFNFFGKSSDEEAETPEDKLINTIKRSVLCIQREQYEKAERMLHLALRMAQDLQSHEGITYVYDVMANLAMEREQFKKAEKIFADVMKRLFAAGHREDSPQILHISSKLAHMAQLQGELDKANDGFTWTLKKIEEHLRKVPEDKDVRELMGLTKNWYGQLLMKQGKYAEAKKYFQEAYDCLVEIYGAVNEEAVTILNNLSVACVNLDDFVEAKKYLIQALELVKELKDTTQEGILQANMGLIYLREGLVAQAKEACALAWRIGKKTNNANAIEQAEYCLEEIKSFVQ